MMNIVTHTNVNAWLKSLMQATLLRAPAVGRLHQQLCPARMTSCGSFDSLSTILIPHNFSLLLTPHLLRCPLTPAHQRLAEVHENFEHYCLIFCFWHYHSPSGSPFFSEIKWRNDEMLPNGIIWNKCWMIMYYWHYLHLWRVSSLKDFMLPVSIMNCYIDRLIVQTWVLLLLFFSIFLKGGTLCIPSWGLCINTIAWKNKWGNCLVWILYWNMLHSDTSAICPNL